MKILTCPMNGPRNITEFQYLGPFRAMPDPDDASDTDWAQYLFRAENSRGPVVEWWRHTPSNYVFLAERHLGTGDVIRTFDPSEGRPS
ncbi:MAG: sarcosine oxidase subunit delta [Paracoccaceae bacterium]|jgi:sarcosine oxidase subunit delta|nr:sarcosine oxidase subunit delta [Paracoccaceae bacterium]MDG1737617.1 sarcosine oxidase subunit delta [Paracoccaceae bacterium]MDG2257704.1 sarcosine oxidase subunit delta [Paracoccaceae bacterium]